MASDNDFDLDVRTSAESDGSPPTTNYYPNYYWTYYPVCPLPSQGPNCSVSRCCGGSFAPA
jgi:hypothetical protein